MNASVAALVMTGFGHRRGGVEALFFEGGVRISEGDQPLSAVVLSAVEPVSIQAWSRAPNQRAPESHDQVTVQWASSTGYMGDHA